MNYINPESPAPFEGQALIYCEGAFGTTNGKTAHGLLRRSERYRILGVIDTTHAGNDAGAILTGKPSGIPIFRDLAAARAQIQVPLTHFVIGLAPDGGRMSASTRQAILAAIKEGLHVDSGLHDFLTADPEIVNLAQNRGVQLRDVRKPPPRPELHFFSGKISTVTALKIAVLGTDSAVGKRTTAWCLVDALRQAGYVTELIGTGQTAWLQGARYGIMLDSLVNDFVAGELEHAVWRAWTEQQPQVLVIEGQGSLLHPAFPGGFEILAATRPEMIILQHAPARREYDGMPGYPLHPLPRQIQAIEIMAGRQVEAITINHENLAPNLIDNICIEIARATGIPTFDVLIHGAEKLVSLVTRHLQPQIAR